jgi:type I restriction enzyme S subunit
MKPQPVAFEHFYSEPSRNGVYKPAQFRGQGIRMVNMGELFGHEFVGNQIMERVELSDEELIRSQLQDGDLLFGRRSVVEEGAGKCCLVV